MLLDDYLEHFGVKGMRWGVRRAESRAARTKRIKDGTATLRDKFIREADLDGGRTQAIKLGEIHQSKSEKVGIKVLGVVMITVGAIQLRQLAKEL